MLNGEREVAWFWLLHAILLTIFVASLVHMVPLQFLHGWVEKERVFRVTVIIYIRFRHAKWLLFMTRPTNDRLTNSATRHLKGMYEDAEISLLGCTC